MLKKIIESIETEGLASPNLGLYLEALKVQAFVDISANLALVRQELSELNERQKSKSITTPVEYKR